jgi:cytochrome c2
VAVSGSPRLGKQLIARYKCGTCHAIPGIPRAHGVFGPPLNFLARRTILAGNFPNTPGNLVRWIMSPKSMKPGTAMPDLGLDERQARNVAAYLETLR